jgi:hypothetical protein
MIRIRRPAAGDRRKELVMEIKGKKFVSLYLTDWQMRMVKDFLGVDCHQWTVEINGPPVMRYMAPPFRKEDLDPEAKRMYLTDWQKREIEDLTGEKCEFIELKSGAVVKYMGPPMAEIKERLAAK